MSGVPGTFALADLSAAFESVAGGASAVETSSMCRCIAEAILDDPQHFIDALVEAGVLERDETTHDRKVYAVVQPHVHEWRVEYADHAHSPDYAFIFCLDCKEQRRVPNRLPIEVPE